MNKKIRAAIVGYGNIGRYVIDTILQSPDLKLLELFVAMLTLFLPS